MMGPGLFSNIGKRAKNLLTKGCTRDQKLTISTVTASVLVLTSASVKKKELYTHDISSVYKHKNTVINVIMGAESNISTTLTVLEALPSTNLLICVELPDNKGGKLELHYCHFHKNASFATKIGMKPYPVLKISGTVGAPGVALGAEVQYDTAKGEFTKYNAAIGVTKHDFHIAFILSNKGDRIKVSGLYHFDEKHRA
ncbi:hypothetical protein EJB05_22287 [Eragrostis curvula]|uniref:Uncharacterized protein n=1 Tax=Eragrostis curvula TaxID=38414 RepID=A0A5J9V421_9POAL|nr:hypothetical protein EJB05_22287 [Eragrostis curvula]